MNDKSNNGVSIADIISLIGVLASAATVGLGVAYFTFNMLAAVLTAIGVLTIEGILISLTVKFKKKDESLEKWRMAEYLCVGLLVLCGIATIFPVSYFTGVMQDKDSLQGVAREDIAAIRQSVENFQQQERNALERTCGGLRNIFLVHNPQESAELKSFIDQNSISSPERIDQYSTNETRLIDRMTLKSASGSGTESYADAWDRDLNEASSYIDNWSVFMLPIGIATIETIGTQTKEVSEKMTEELKYPIITRHDNIYIIDADSQDVTPCDANLNFRKALKEVPTFSVTGFCIVMVTFLLILFSYFLAPRSRRMEINKNRTINQGQIL